MAFVTTVPDIDPLYTTPEPAALARWLAARYPLGENPSCRLLRRGLNDVYRVETASGQRYIFRLSQLRARGAADVATETAFLAHLRERGAPVAGPVATREGPLFLLCRAPEGAREGVLFEALEGREPDFASAVDARAHGATLARIHDAAETFRAAAPLYCLDLDHLLRRPLQRALASGLLEDAAVRDELTGITERTGRRIEALDGLTWTHCHGDCHGGNARIGETGEAAFFDFDDGGPGYLAYDLAVFLWAKISFGRKLTAMWDAFLQGYRSIRPIDARDFEAVHLFVIVRHLWIMGEFASRADEWGAESVGWVARENGFLKAWEAERLDIRLF
jgi:Ser/Thr protein kinase RdoA (MazF antagonist)